MGSTPIPSAIIYLDKCINMWYIPLELKGIIMPKYSVQQFAEFERTVIVEAEDEESAQEASINGEYDESSGSEWVFSNIVDFDAPDAIEISE